MKKDSNRRQGFYTSLNILSPKTEASQQQEEGDVPSSLRHFQKFDDYGTDFIWLNDNDHTYNDEDIYIEVEDALANFPREVVDNYDVWVGTYTDNFKERLDDTGDFHADVFPTATQEVAWNVAGFLLGWRIAMAPHVGSVEFSPGSEKYLLRNGEDEENDVICSFLECQAMLLAERKRQKIQ